MKIGAPNGVLIGIEPAEMRGEEEDGWKKVGNDIVLCGKCVETFQNVQMQMVGFCFEK